MAKPLEIPESGAETFLMGRDHLPRSTRWARLLCKALYLPLVSRSRLIQRLLCATLGIPASVSLSAGFYSRGGRLHCGQDCALADTTFFDYAPVYIDDHVTFSYRNIVITSTHDLTDFRRVIAKPVVLERNVWVTANVTILGGVRIGRNSVIAAGSVVTRDIPANVLAGGNPCKPIREIRRDVEGERLSR